MYPCQVALGEHYNSPNRDEEQAWFWRGSHMNFCGCCNKYPQTKWLKQHKFILNSRGQMSDMGLTGLNSRCQQDCVPFEGPRAGSVLLPFLASRGCPPVLACRPFLHLQSTSHSPLALITSLSLTLLYPSYKGHVITLDSPR